MFFVEKYGLVWIDDYSQNIDCYENCIWSKNTAMLWTHEMLENGIGPLFGEGH